MSAEVGGLGERLREALRIHHLGGDTAQLYDAAGQCGCGQVFYERGGDPAAFLLANQRMHVAHSAHLADVAVQVVAEWLRGQRETVASGLAAKEWRESAWSAHAEHNFDAWCEICAGNTDAIAGAALAALAYAIGGGR